MRPIFDGMAAAREKCVFQKWEHHYDFPMFGSREQQIESIELQENKGWLEGCGHGAGEDNLSTVALAVHRTPSTARKAPGDSVRAEPRRKRRHRRNTEVDKILARVRAGSPAIQLIQVLSTPFRPATQLSRPRQSRSCKSRWTNRPGASSGQRASAPVSKFSSAGPTGRPCGESAASLR